MRLGPVVPEILCEACGKRMFHENPTTLAVEVKIHKKFCRDSDGSYHSYMHRDASHHDPFDAERAADMDGVPVLKK